MNCLKIYEKLSDYLEDKLTRGEEISFRDHLKRCPKCFDELIRKEPSKLFLLLQEKKDQGEVFWRALEKDILGEIDREEKRKVPNILKKASLSLAASLVLILSVWFVMVLFSGKRAPSVEPLPLIPPDGSSIERVGLEIETTESGAIQILKYEFNDGALVDWMVIDKLPPPGDPLIKSDNQRL